MRVKRLLILIATLSISCFMFGCGTSDGKVNNSEQIKEIENSETTDIVPTDNTALEEKAETIESFEQEYIESENYGFQFKYPVDKLIWDKEKKEFDHKYIQLDKNWGENIFVENKVISSKTPTDISTINNYFFTTSDSYNDLFTAYGECKSYEINQSSSIGNLSNGELSITTIPYGNNQLISSVKYICTTNAFEGGIEELKGISNYNAGRFGIGSTYKDVVSVIGKTSNQNTSEGVDCYITAASYQSYNVSLSLLFMHVDENDLDNGVLTSIIWTPRNIQKV